MTRMDPQEIRFSLAASKGWGMNPDALQIALLTWTNPNKKHWVKTASQEWVIQDPGQPKSSGLPMAVVSVPLAWSLGNFYEPYRVVVKERATIDVLFDFFVRYYAGFDLAASNDLLWRNRIEWCVLRESYPEYLDEMWRADGRLEWEANQAFTLWEFFSNHK